MKEAAPSQRRKGKGPSRERGGGKGNREGGIRVSMDLLTEKKKGAETINLFFHQRGKGERKKGKGVLQGKGKRMMYTLSCPKGKRGGGTFFRSVSVASGKKRKKLPGAPVRKKRGGLYSGAKTAREEKRGGEGIKAMFICLRKKGKRKGKRCIAVASVRKGKKDDV